MGVIAVYSIKGGVGKTTLAFELAWRCAQAGQRTLLWDLDLQGGAGFLLDEDLPAIPRAVSAFRPGGLLRQQVRATRFERLFHMPADESLRILPNELARLRERQRMAGLAHLLSSEFTRIVLDCPPVMNEVSDQIITAADIIVVPLPPSPLAIRALEAITRELAHNHPNPPPVFPVLSMYDARRKLHRETLEVVARHWPAIPLASDVERIAARRAPIDTFAPASKAARALADLHTRLEERLVDVPPRPLPPPRPAYQPRPPQSAGGQRGGGQRGRGGGRPPLPRGTGGPSLIARFLRWMLQS